MALRCSYWIPQKQTDSEKKLSSILEIRVGKRRRAINEGQSSAALGIHWPLGGEH
ncbi:hypothetical protein PVK06_027627 [Gossypium arboreum]|uniref:Uncharacterized protein n=1 Tax=Gossypium arboreum TaxID=29729 RepID=A0ABR0P106_GOSAR|nr:hypothetical protein PVK06_027627 [Gossypium arboreum]